MPGIVVGVDGSDDAQRALEWAVGEAAGRKVPLTVLSVVPVGAPIGPGNPSGYVPVPASELRDAEEAAQIQADKATAGHGQSVAVAVTVRATGGTPVEELLEAAADADLLVVGSRGRGGFARLLLGSVSSQVVQHATCPTVVVPTRPRPTVR